MSAEHPLGFAPSGDFDAVGYEPPPPGENPMEHMKPFVSWLVMLSHGQLLLRVLFEDV